MSIKKILRIGHPSLLDVARPVTKFNTPDLDLLVQDMLDTMLDANGAGLAAPQIGVNLRVVIFCVENNPRYPDKDAIPLTVLINPEIIPVGSEMEPDWEGCLSVPGMRGWVSRYKYIKYKGMDQKGQSFEYEVDGFHARVVQHECDHLDGVLYPQRITDLRKFGYIEELFPDLETNEFSQ